MNIVTSSPVNTTVKQFGHGPQNAQHKENASERREVGKVMEQRYKTETAHADSKDSLALHAGELQHFPVAVRSFARSSYSIFPFSAVCSRSAGTSIEIKDGRNISLMTPPAVIMPAFHSMIVVTSPIGEKAPPELAEMITSEA